MSSRFFDEGYIPPATRLKLMLKPNKEMLNPRSPSLTGYVTFDIHKLEMIRKMIEADPHKVIHMRVAIWADGNNNEDYPVQGNIDYTQYLPPTEEKIEQRQEPPTVWY
jgi:hypothetical protein